MNKYKLLICSFSELMKDNSNPFDKILSSTELISYSLYEHFKKLNYVETIVKINEKYPECDFIIISDYFDMLRKLNFEELKKQTKCKKIAIVMEFPFNQKEDHNFCFIDNISERNTYIPAPCNKNKYLNIKKESNTILIDHSWPEYKNEGKDWTNKIESWLESISKDYRIFRLIRLAGEEKTLPSYIKPIKYDYFPKYLLMTNLFENFIITHTESYSYGVLDMLARGIRVITPQYFIRTNELIKYFNLPIFSSQEELISILKTPINKEETNSYINKMTDYSEIVQKIDEYFQKQIG